MGKGGGGEAKIVFGILYANHSLIKFIKYAKLPEPMN